MMHFFSPLQRFGAGPSIGLAILLLFLFAGPSAWAQRYTVEEAGLDGGGGFVTAGNRTLTASIGGSSPVGTVRAGQYVLYSGLLFPRVPIFIVYDETEEGAVRGQNRSITARILANQGEVRSATLYYRPGDGDEFTAETMQKEETGYTASIPGEAIGPSGLFFYFVATNDQGTNIREPRNGVFSLTVRLPEAGARKPGGQTGGTSQAAYRLVSMPVELDDPTPEAVLGDDLPSLASPSAYDPSAARLFEPIGTRVAEYPGTGNFDLGNAFWLIVRDDVEAIDSGAGTTGRLNTPVRIPLSQGWNFVGTPFPVSVPVSNLQTASGAPIRLRSYGSNGYNTPDAPVTSMTPFEGYAVYVPTATTLIVNPPVPSAKQAAKASETVQPPSFPWRLRIRGSSKAGWDADNVAAVHPSATEGFDPLDWPEPPALASDLTIAFDAPKGAPDDVTLSADVRTPPSRGTTWPFTVTTTTDARVRLSLDGMDQVPSEFDAWLVDETTKDTWNLRRTSQTQLAMVTKGTERPMRLVVGTPAYVKEVLRDLEALPDTYALAPPYPNPSVGPVAFQVGLPEDDRVTVEVYNILGQRIATLKNRESMTAGYHTIVWNAPRLASGLYFVRMEAGSFRQTQKLVRIR